MGDRNPGWICLCRILYFAQLVSISLRSSQNPAPSQGSVVRCLMPSSHPDKACSQCLVHTGTLINANWLSVHPHGWALGNVWAGQSFGMESTYPVSAKKALHQTMKTHFAISIYSQSLEATIMPICISLCGYDSFLFKIGLVPFNHILVVY